MFHHIIAMIFGALLMSNSPGRWINRRVNTAWKARSPDLTSLDFFAWWFNKDFV